MMKFSILTHAVFVASLMPPASAATAASVNKTWVASYGVDTGTCPLSAPCKTFQYAHDQTNSGGEIDVKDSGAYGTVAIQKAISIVADGVLASINVPESGYAILIRGTGNVVLQGLTIDGHGLPLSAGIYFQGSQSVVVKNCNIRNTDVGFDGGLNNSNYIYIINNVITGNRVGIKKLNSNVFISNNAIVANKIGITGAVYSYGDNIINGNTIDSQDSLVSAPKR